MANCETDCMAKDTKFMDKWKNTPKEEKEYVRVTMLTEAAEFLNKQAFEDFGMHQSAVSMEISKLILIAKQCLENKGE
jgi:hypothetical protein